VVNVRDGEVDVMQVLSEVSYLVMEWNDTLDAAAYRCGC